MTRFNIGTFKTMFILYLPVLYKLYTNLEIARLINGLLHMSQLFLLIIIFCY